MQNSPNCSSPGAELVVVLEALIKSKLGIQRTGHITIHLAKPIQSIETRSLGKYETLKLLAVNTVNHTK